MATCTQCIDCQHYREMLTCDAFPDRIPVAILTGEHDHREPYPGDHGITFAPVPRSDSPADTG